MNSGQILMLVLLGAIAVGCETKAPDGSSRRHYFGYTVVKIPKTAPERPDFCVREVVNVGIAFGGGDLGLGYNNTKIVSLPPNGAIYLEVFTDEQFEKARELVEMYNEAGLGLCVTKKQITKTVAAQP